MKISACWITKNEAKTLLRSIESIGGIADELVVVDTGSTDDTVETARAAGARVEYFEWVGDFALARNYALSQTSGDVAIFLDADEWFVPTLTESDRRSIEQIFAENKEVDAVQLAIKNLNNEGAVKTVSTGNRIIRRTPDLIFIKRIHEQLVHANGDLPLSAVNDDWSLHHTGYVETVLSDKMKRNIELLEQAVKEARNAEERHLQYCYLVREMYHGGDLQGSIKHLRLALDEPDMMRRHFMQYQHAFASLVYLLINVAPDARDKVSRKEIHKKLIDPFKRYIPDYPGVPMLELYYNCLFEFKEDVLLKDIGPALEAAHKMPPSTTSNYIDAETLINQAASEACLRRGRITETMDYSVAAFKHSLCKRTSALRPLLGCMRGLPPQEIIVFLNSIFDVKIPQRLEFLSAGTRMHGFRDVHAYYLDKCINAGLATKGDYLYLLLLYGKYKESAQKAVEFYDETNADVTSKGLFLAAVCADDETIYRGNEKLLSNYARILDAYFARGELSSPTKHELEILTGQYELIAMAAGLERADSFRSIYKSQDLLGFQVKARYCFENGLYEMVLNEKMPNPDDYLSNRFVIQSLTMIGRGAEALDRIAVFFEEGTVDSALLQYLLAVADRAEGDIKSRARSLYDRYSVLYDYFIDLEDLIHTGYISDDTDKKKSKAMKSLTPAQFNKQFNEEKAKPFIKGLAGLCEQAGEIYANRSMPAMAIEQYRLAIAQGHDTPENYEQLSEMFMKTGNKQLAAEMKKRAHSQTK